MFRVGSTWFCSPRWLVLFLSQKIQGRIELPVLGCPSFPDLLKWCRGFYKIDRGIFVARLLRCKVVNVDFLEEEEGNGQHCVNPEKRRSKCLNHIYSNNCFAHNIVITTMTWITWYLKKRSWNTWHLSKIFNSYHKISKRSEATLPSLLTSVLTAAVPSRDNPVLSFFSYSSAQDKAEHDPNEAQKDWWVFPSLVGWFQAWKATWESQRRWLWRHFSRNYRHTMPLSSFQDVCPWCHKPHGRSQMKSHMQRNEPWQKPSCWLICVNKTYTCRILEYVHDIYI